MVLGKLPVLGRPTIWIIVGQGLTALFSKHAAKVLIRLLVTVSVV